MWGSVDGRERGDRRGFRFALGAVFGLTIAGILACSGGGATIVPPEPTPTATRPAATSQPTAIDPTVTAVPVSTESAASPPQISMGGSALGGNASTVVLAQLPINDLPSGPLAWVTHRLELDDGESLDHSHRMAFVYAEHGNHRLDAGGSVEDLETGEGAAVGARIQHRHSAVDGPSSFWETRLDRPGSGLADPYAPTIFESEILEDIPDNPLAVFVLVVVPPGGETSVHTHPGPEFIYQQSGDIDYQNEIIGTKRLMIGDAEGIPPETSVQKRNPYEEDAAFLSWFLVDPAQPFASPAVFSDPGRGINLALMENGASVSGVSSNFGGGADDSNFGARNALDGDPSTEWSSAGDGDDAWIEVELAEVTRIRSVGFWTRTMGDSAQVRSFQVTTGDGEVHGPFAVDDATTIYYFDTNLEAKRLKFEVLETSGGNTGALEIEVYGDPVR